jgi:hypothetical protein
MKTKFKYLTLVATSLLLGLSSCNNEDEVNTGQPQEGAPTKLSLSISQPQTYAADPNATTAESKLSTVDVYIYDASDNYIKREHFLLSDFTVDGTIANKWNLNSGKEITTTAGLKNIYVGVNLPAALATAIEGTNPRTAARTVTSASDLNTADGIAMFSRVVQSPVLVETTDPTYPGANKVSVTVARLLSKVSVEKGSALPTGVISLTGGTIQDLEFAVSNVNTKFFPYPSISFLDPNHTSPWTALSEFIEANAGAYQAVNANGTAATSARVDYATENTSLGNLAAEHTYVSVRGTYVPSAIVKLVTPANPADGVVADAPITAGTTFYLVTVNGQKNFFQNLTHATDFAAHHSVSVQTYQLGVAYYNAFLNPVPAVGENKYDVLRNTFYKVSITKVNGIGEPGDGTGTTPTTPISDPTLLSIEVDVEPWALASQDSELEGK